MIRLVQFILLGVTGATALGFTIHTGIRTAQYLLLNTPCSLNVYKWDIEEKKSEFYVVAEYTYEVKGACYQGSSRVGPPELNPYAAQTVIRKQPCPVVLSGWCRGWNPAVSEVQKKMPWNGVVQSVLAWALAGYFFLMRSGSFRAYRDLSQNPKQN